MKQIAALMLAILPITAIAADDEAYRTQSNAEIRQLFWDATEMDGERGATIDEVVSTFGESDKTINRSEWHARQQINILTVQHIYILSENRRMEIDVRNEKVMFAIISNPRKDSYLLWK